MKIEVASKSIPLTQPFAIARGTKTHCDLVRVTIRSGSHIARGECTPSARYGETVTSVIEQIKQMRPALAHLSPAAAKSHLQTLPAGAARNALDCAIWEMIALKNGTRFPAPYFDIQPKIATAMTVSIDTPTKMAKQASQYLKSGATLLKIKLDSHLIVERVKAVRQVAPDCEIILDANEAWQHLDLPALFLSLSDLNVAMIEQPVPSGYDSLLRGIARPVPICADESCHTHEDLHRLEGAYDIINIKLDKSGGLTEALILEKMAREKGFKIMVGCMLGTSMAMKAALPIATRADIVDLDGPVLLGTDVDDGLIYESGHLTLGE
ncbi:N-acetyl-D-Glu racemase DgcA [Vibrio ostreicida]|uniref:N-acetyl-D-Glu racemase DgcA n=1 Tax=Vibrio ostreicida TaxID=526588 RepID=UPI0009706B96|nr:N-acetyl-D-Glu racemase DgcA [Vibrio ostreicida]